ncbi:MAG: spondin domain-containing protein [Planctomycetota bacterium]
MKRTGVPKALYGVLVGCCAIGTVSAQPTAEYRVTLDATWSVESHPNAFPPDAHFSPFVGAVHDGTYSMWEPGTTASDGMEDMAETGDTSVLAFEVVRARSQGRATELLRGPFLLAGESGGDAFTAETSHPLLTVVSMIAPSPDWFVGIRGVDLRPGGRWVERLEIELHAYDAGTDSGLDFLSGDIDTSPRDPITDFAATVPFANTPHVAVLIIERTDTPCIADATTDGTNPGDAGFGFPDGAVTVSDLSYFVEAWVSTDALLADVTTDTTNPGDPGFGTPDGAVTISDLTFFVEAWVSGCP